jgi:hypothetical protein
LLPEFPLKKDNNNQSTKVDYVCYDYKKRIIYFVELKTDSKSFNKRQLEVYKSYTTWGRCLNELNAISVKTRIGYRTKFEAAQEILKTSGISNSDSHSIPIKLIYISPITPKMSKYFNELENALVVLIDFNKLMKFKPKNHKEEWSLFLKYFSSYKDN